MNENSEIFIVYMAFLNLVSAPEIYPNKVAQIASLLIKKVSIPDKYSDFVNVFAEEKALLLPKLTKLNEHAINLEDDNYELF